MDFKQKISLRRARDSGAVPEPGADAWLLELGERLESDRGRILNSAAVRRLQQKTQVFPLERNAAVRSRLTHSLEVQQVGRHIVRTLFQRLGPRASEYGLDGLERVLETLVEMACLSHDIGTACQNIHGLIFRNHSHEQCELLRHRLKMIWPRSRISRPRQPHTSLRLPLRWPAVTKFGGCQ